MGLPAPRTGMSRNRIDYKAILTPDDAGKVYLFGSLPKPAQRPVNSRHMY